jgi:hypothetical protein
VVSGCAPPPSSSSSESPPPRCELAAAEPLEVVPLRFRETAVELLRPRAAPAEVGVVVLLRLRDAPGDAKAEGGGLLLRMGGGGG